MSCHKAGLNAIVTLDKHSSLCSRCSGLDPVRQCDVYIVLATIAYVLQDIRFCYRVAAQAYYRDSTNFA
jgi:hypothetical protein